jgi:hypothetical protein
MVNLFRYVNFFRRWSYLPRVEGCTGDEEKRRGLEEIGEESGMDRVVKIMKRGDEESGEDSGIESGEEIGVVKRM